MSSPASGLVPNTHGPAPAEAPSARGRVEEFVLTGTPVVPGRAFGPVVRPSEGVQLPDGHQPELPGAARAAEKELFRAAAELVAARLAARAAAATGVSAEVLTTTAGIARDRALWGAAEQRIDSGAPAAVATAAAAEQFVDMFTAAGRPDGRTGAPICATSATVSSPNSPVCRSPASRSPTCRRSCSPRTWRPPTPRAWIPRWSSAWPPRWAARPATPRSSRGSWGSRAWWRSTGLDDVAAGDDGARRRHARDRDGRARPGRGRGGGRGGTAAAERCRGWTGPGATRGRPRRCGPGQRAGRRRCAAAAADTRRGRRPVPHRAVLPRPRDRADGRRAGADLRARCSTRSPAARW